MTVGAWLKQAVSSLETEGVGGARLDCLVLLEDELRKDRAWLLAHPEHKISPNQLLKLNKKLKRRATHEPLAYIRGFSEFYGRKFKVNKRVLEPRPESEDIVDLIKELSRDHELSAKSCIADIGTGSGAIGITLALELHNPNIDLYDIDAGALAVAKHNVELHELRLKLYKRDLANRLARHYALMAANLPYVPDGWKINEAAAMEPRVAIFGGHDGLVLYRRFFSQLKAMQAPPQYVLTEALPPQHPSLAKIAARAGYKARGRRGFIQVFRTGV